MNKPHKHAELIKQWADGAEIELRSRYSEEWNFTSAPCWGVDREYRVKPQPVEGWVNVYLNGGFGNIYAALRDAQCYSSIAVVKTIFMREVTE